MKNLSLVGRITLLCLLTTFFAGLALGQTDNSFVSYRNNASRICPILDAPYPADASFSIGHALAATHDAPGWDEISVTELDGWMRYFIWENDTGGELELRAAFNSSILRNFDGAGSGYPLTSITLPVAWSQRYEDSVGLQAEMRPGLFTALDGLSGKALGIPMGCRIIKAIDPDTAVFAGAWVYPGFDRTLDPWVGFHWDDREMYSVDLAYPETKLAIGPYEGCTLTLGARMLLWPEYDMGEDERETIRYDETRAYLGVSCAVAEGVNLSLQVGAVLDRSLEFESGATPVEIDDSAFIQFGISTLL